MSEKARELPKPKSRKQLRLEAIEKSKMKEKDLRPEVRSDYLIPELDYDMSRNVLDCVPTGMM